MAPYVPPAVPATRELDVLTFTSDPTEDVTLPSAHVPAVAACAVATEDVSAPLLTPTARAYIDGTSDVADGTGRPMHPGPQ